MTSNLIKDVTKGIEVVYETYSTGHSYFVI